jgi:hypothetical protein
MLQYSSKVRPNLLKSAIRTSPWLNHTQRRSVFLTPLYGLTSDILSFGHGVIGIPWLVAIPTTTFLLKYAVGRFMKSNVTDLQAQNYMPNIYMSAVKNLPTQVMKQQLDLTQQIAGTQRSKSQRAQWTGDWVATWMRFHGHIAQERYQVPNTILAGVKAFVTNIVIWLTLSDTLRYMLGANLGLLSWIYPSWLAPANPQAFIDPSLAVEGFPWCVLTAADPTYVMPVALSALMSYITFGPSSLYVPVISNLTARLHLQDNMLWKYSTQLAPYAFVPTFIWLLSGLPSGLLLYWASSATSGILLSRFRKDNLKDVIFQQQTLPTPCLEGFDAFRLPPKWLSGRPLVTRKRAR